MSLSPTRSAPNPYLLVFVGWLFPGAGLYLLDRRYRRRALLFSAIIHLTFFIGVCLHGGLSWPSWSLQDISYNVVNNLNFIFQTGAGWPALASLVAYAREWTMTIGGSAFEFHNLEPHPFNELGGFYCLVAGALNYFVICQTIERRDKKPFEKMAKQ